MPPFGEPLVAECLRDCRHWRARSFSDLAVGGATSDHGAVQVIGIVRFILEWYPEFARNGTCSALREPREPAPRRRNIGGRYDFFQTDIVDREGAKPFYRRDATASAGRGEREWDAGG